MKQAVLFDFDGTIADSFEYVLAFLQKEAGDDHSFDTAQRQALRQMSMRRLALTLGVPITRSPFIYFRGRKALRAHMEQLKPFAGMVETIQSLHAKGYALFIVSLNSSKNIHRFLRHYNIDHCFAGVKGGTGMFGKRTQIKQIIVSHRLNRKTCWYVGDETSDIVVASVSGIHSIAVSWGFANPDNLKRIEPGGLADTPADIIRLITETTWKK